MVRVGLHCLACVPMRVLCPLHCRAQPCSELSQLLPAAGLCLLGAGRGVVVLCQDGRQMLWWAKQAVSVCAHIAEDRGWMWPPCPAGDRQWVHEGGLRTPFLSPFDAQGGMWLLKQSLCCHGHGACCTLRQ